MRHKDLQEMLITNRTAQLPGSHVKQGRPVNASSHDQVIPVAQPRQNATACSVDAANGLPAGGVAEYRFHPKRRWRFDWAWPDARVALEIEGGAWTGGRHTRGKGFIGDMEKYNNAALLGWRVLRVTPSQVSSGEACTLVMRALFGIEIKEL